MGPAEDSCLAELPIASLTRMAPHRWVKRPGIVAANTPAIPRDRRAGKLAERVGGRIGSDLPSSQECDLSLAARRPAAARNVRSQPRRAGRDSRSLQAKTDPCAGRSFQRIAAANGLLRRQTGGRAIAVDTYYLPAYMIAALDPETGLQGISLETAMEDGRLDPTCFTPAQRAAIWDWAKAYWRLIGEEAPPISLAKHWAGAFE